ncbi:hypothetical protein PIIN_05020 [Serendipita indica DSM 11827]|uniref:NADH:ubiquinone oxidoreductase intermediate-associated protein 30 domain-containing protein n=1 Tax=Serendipita indica (strain DSM 11827) TaxID=1109443 RepID=G4TIF0_SERID|nr:hypothetical protein PIIN_05020 [Serendipita indica DSM 11827]
MASTVTLFPPWQFDNWKRVDDSVRGGASISYLTSWQDPNGHQTGASFHGHLDITVLGGAGFASQIPISHSSPNTPSDFVVTLKTQPPPPRSQPKPRSQLVYEASFTLSSAPEIVLPLDTFVPTYRGREVKRGDPHWRPFDPQRIYEIGLMCRSNFGKQSGDFELVVSRIDIVCTPSSTRWRRTMNRIRKWLCLSSYFIEE